VNTERALKLIKNRKLVTIVGLLLLSLLSNALWEYAAKPLLFLSRDTLLNIATLGIASFKNDCYRLIARGFTESPSLSLLSEFDGLYICAYIVAGFWLYNQIRKINADKREFDEMCKGLERDDNDLSKRNRPSTEVLRIKISSLTTMANLLIWFFIAFLVFFISIKAQSGVKEIYVNAAVTHYKQMISICRPYIDEKEAQLIESKFSQISNKEDYSSLMKGLYRVCDKKGIKYEKFLPW